MSWNRSPGTREVDRYAPDLLAQTKRRRGSDMHDVSPQDLAIVPDGSDTSFWECLFSRSEGPEVALLHAKAFWPDFLEVEGFILLAENYDRDYFERILADYGAPKLEATVNTTYLESLFGAGEAKPDVIEALGRVLCDSWQARARTLFPDREFVAHFDWYSSDGDPGVVLHQRKWPCLNCNAKGGEDPDPG